MIIIGPKGKIQKVVRKPVVLSPESQLSELIAEYKTDPEGFVYDVIKADPDEQQAEILRAVAQPGAHVSVRAGHGTGKSSVESWIILWYLSCFDDCRIPCTAPSAHQLYDILWAEVAKWRGQMNTLFSQRLLQTQDKIVVRGQERNQFAIARTSRRDQPEALQGFHAENVLFVIDEASAVEDKVFEVAEGALSSAGSRVIMCGNPTRSDGYFFRSHTTDRAHWNCIHMSSERSRFVDKKWSEEMALKYGKDSNVYRVRVLGEFPTQSDDTLIPIDWVTAAVGRDIDIQPAFRRIAGLDVARFGNDANGYVVRQGQVITKIAEWSHCDLMATCGRVAAAYRENKEFDAVYVDVIGMGSGVVDRLQEMGVPAFGINVAESPSGANDGRFMRLRDQLWWAVREWFSGHGCRIEPGLTLCDQLIAECSGVRYNLTSAGKTVIESKDDMKKRGMASPNLADSLCLTFAPGKEVSVVQTRARARKVIVPSSLGWT